MTYHSVPFEWKVIFEDTVYINPELDKVAIDVQEENSHGSHFGCLCISEFLLFLVISAAPPQLCILTTLPGSKRYNTARTSVKGGAHTHSVGA